ncbi:VOC family protein [Hyphomonas sp.]|jgi:hydroxymethylpyrimidine/phosphomethylpyrimidine kinase|uniref:VOC family protein n=1 Tax=Hyphomonas sp. TaxID=87 RepID=UPI0032D93245
MILNQITIPCVDYSASVAFYEALGMVRIVEAPPRYARFESADGSGATLSLHTVSASVGSGTVIYFDHPSAGALDAHVEDLKAQGLVFDSEPADESWGWREARLRDPAGNEVCLMFAGEARRFPDWRVDGRTG